MPKPFVQLTIEEFAEKLRSFRFTRSVTAVHMHHTWSPTKASYAGLNTIEGMWAFHTKTNGWSDIAQHLSIAPDGTVWTGRDWNRTPASATGFNDGAFMFETIGNFDIGHEQLTGAQRDAVVEVIARMQLKCGLPLESLHFHREFTDAKTCPGTGVKKAEILEEVRAARLRLGGDARDLRAALSDGNGADVLTEDAGDPLARPFGERELASAEPAEETEVDCAGDGDRQIIETTSVALDDRAREALTPDDLGTLRRFVISLRQGRFSDATALATDAADVDAIFTDHLPAALDRARKQDEPLRLVFCAQAGLVDDAAHLQLARILAPWWLQNHVYPIYFVWEAGFWETIRQLIGGRRELTAARDAFDLMNGPIEELARRAGVGKIWDGMKHGAQRSVEPDGGAQYVARKLAEFCSRHSGQVELHAVAHGAGSIFHSYFVPAARSEGAPAFRSLTFLAPAIRVKEFLDRLGPMLGSGGGVDALTLFTMRKDLERADHCGPLYHKSLLYLIQNALEARRGEPILGLEESIRAEAALASVFGLGTNARGSHEIVWSTTTAASGRSASRATSHGGFEYDRATMESVVRRVRGLADTDRVEPFPAAAARAFSFDALLARESAATGAPAPAEQTVVPDRATFSPPQPSPSRPAVPPPLPPAPSRPTPSRIAGRLVRALCVGIDKYPGNAELHGCVADATTWATELRALGFKRVDVLRDKEATQDRLRHELASLVKAGAPGDVLVFQYAGHGTFFADKDADEPDRKDEAIVPVDFRDGRFILDDEIFDIFDDLADGVALTAFFDCCHSGSISRMAFDTALREATSDDVLPRFIDPTPAMWDEYRNRRAQRRELVNRGRHDVDANKAVVFSACRDDQVALERAGHGVFTTHVAPMLREAVSAGTPNEEFQKKIVRVFGRESNQNPQLDCATRAKKWPLLRLGGVPTTAPARDNGGDGKREETAKDWNTIVGSLHSMETGAVEELIQQAQAILSQSRTS